jgi:hypothetical protein
MFHGHAIFEQFYLGFETLGVRRYFSFLPMKKGNDS